MTDSELLELAAKATGFYWNPLNDDGDALQLAVDLGLTINFADHVTTAEWKSGDTWNGCSVTHDDDPYAATRQAIVRAAAEIGKGMK